MKKIIKITMGMLVAISIFGCQTEVDYSEYENRIAELEESNSSKDKENEDLKTKVSALEEDNSSKDKENSDLKTKVTSLEESNATKDKENSDLKTENSDLKTENSDLKTTVSNLESDINSKNQEITDLYVERTNLMVDNDKKQSTINSLQDQYLRARNSVISIYAKVIALNTDITTETITSSISDKIDSEKSTTDTISKINELYNSMKANYTNINAVAKNLVGKLDTPKYYDLSESIKNELQIGLNLIVDQSKLLYESLEQLYTVFNTLSTYNTESIKELENVLNELTTLFKNTDDSLIKIASDLDDTTRI